VEIEATRTAQHLRGMASSRGGGWKLLPVATPIVASPPVGCGGFTMLLHFCRIEKIHSKRKYDGWLVRVFAGT